MDPRIVTWNAVFQWILTGILGFQCGSLHSRVDPGIPMCILGFQCESSCSSVKPVWILEFQYGPQFQWTFLDTDGWVWTLVLKCRPWKSSVDSEIPIWMLGFQCECWYSSEDLGVQVWILEFKDWFLVSSVDSGIPVWICAFWDSSVVAGNPVWF